MSKEAVKRVIKEFGGEANMVALFNGGHQFVGNWVRAGYIPYKHLKVIAKTTKVPIKELIKPEYLEIYELIKENENVATN